MRALPPELQTLLESGATTLCWCWRIDRVDGASLGFTDHDAALSFDDVTYEAGSAEESGVIEQTAGFSVDAAAVAGVLSADVVTEADIAGGAYDGAEIRLFRVNWAEPSMRVLIWRGFIGEIRRGETGFEAEIRGLSSALDRSIGRVIQRRCDAELGDARCGVDLDQPSLNGSGVVTTLGDSRRFAASGLSAFASDWFAHGVLTWTSGENAGAVSMVEANRVDAGAVVFELAAPPASPISPGDQFDVVAGCDKRWRSCKDKFANVPNFRGFPMLPGNDWVFAGPDAGADNDGGSLWTDREN